MLHGLHFAICIPFATPRPSSPPCHPRTLATFAPSPPSHPRHFATSSPRHLATSPPFRIIFGLVLMFSPHTTHLPPYAGHPPPSHRPSPHPTTPTSRPHQSPVTRHPARQPTQNSPYTRCILTLGPRFVASLVRPCSCMTASQPASQPAPQPVVPPSYPVTPSDVSPVPPSLASPASPSILASPPSQPSPSIPVHVVSFPVRSGVGPICITTTPSPAFLFFFFPCPFVVRCRRIMFHSTSLALTHV